jgi:transposase
MKTERKNRLNETIRAKIAVQLILNPNMTHKKIADFYGISRQLVTVIADEFQCKRQPTKGRTGSLTHPKRNRANFHQINEKFTKVNTDKLKMIVNLEF